MAATQWEIVSALVTELAKLTGLHPYHAPEPAMQTPAAFPLFDQDYNISWEGASGPVEGDLMIATLWVQGLSRAGARVLADYVDDAGAKSVNAALHGTTLGGVVKSVQVRGLGRGVLLTMPDGRAYYGRPLRLRIYP